MSAIKKMLLMAVCALLGACGGSSQHKDSGGGSGGLPPINAAVGTSPVDLGVVGLHHHPDTVLATGLQFHWYVYNHSVVGSLPSSWQLYLDGEVFNGGYSHDSFAAIAPGDSLSLKAQPADYPDGVHTWTVIIDTKNENVENDENDNRVSIVITPGLAEPASTNQGVQPADAPVAVANDPNLGVDLAPIGLHYHPSAAWGDEGAVTPDSLELHCWCFNHSSNGQSTVPASFQVLVDGQPFTGVNGVGSLPAILPNRWATLSTYPRNGSGGPGNQVPTGTHDWTVRVDDGSTNAESDEGNNSSTISITVVPVGTG